MCDCFHLAFPNWHASATGNGHRLRGPEQETEEDLVCEEPEVLEEERPRPQGSSPVEEFPTTEKYVKQAEGDFYDSPTKSSKKGKKSFGSMFDKRSSGKMNKNEESEMIVKTVKGGCAEGLVVSGGGKDGIFIKEVKKESPASKHLSVKEGDQILSATVYFDNVSYEDALQILEHAQPYKVEFCLKRKPAPTRTQEDAETTRPGVTIGEEAGEEDDAGPEMRGRRKSKKQHDRISWPKFPSFTKGQGAKFKRSHSTSEAEEQRKLEMSPTTSDTESPLKSPLKSLDDKDKKKMHKKKLKMRMTGRRSKSVEETPENAEETDDVEVLNNQNIMNIDEEHSFHESVTNLVEIPNMLDEADKTESIKTRNEFTYPTLPVTESLHKAELITLDNTLKTTDITAAFGEERREISELKVSIQGKDKSEIGTDTQLKSFSSGMGTSDPSTMISVVASPNLLSQDEVVGHQVDSDIKLENKEIFEKTHELEETDMNVPKTDVDKSPMTGSDKGKKERNILETEIYGIRTRGPLADIAISSHFAPNRFDFTSSDPFAFEIKRVTDPQKQSTSRPVISQPKPNALESQRANTDAILGDLGKTSKFELPKVDMSKFEHQETITIKQRDPTKAPVLNREEIEIPGREDKRSKDNYQSPKIKETKVEKIIKISKAGHTKRVPEEFNVDDVKEAVSKFPSFKLPERDITGVLVQREVAMMEMKTGLTPKGSPCKISSISTEIAYVSPGKPETVKEVKQTPSSIVTKDEVNILPQPELYLHDETDINENKTGRSKKAQQSKTGKMLSRDGKISTSPDVKVKLPKREDIEIPGMEANEQKIKTEVGTQDEAVKDYTDVTEKSIIKPLRKGHEKKSKKAKVSMPSFEIAKPDIRIPDIRIELPKKATSSKSDDMKEKMHLDETKQMIESDQMQHCEASTATVTKVPTQDITQDLRASDNKDVKITEPSLAKAEITGKDTNKDWGKIKMPSIDLSLPKVKLTLTEGKSKHKDTGPTKPETDASVEFSKDQKSSESAALTKESVEDVDTKVEDVEDVQDGTGLIEIDGKTEVEPKAEMKESEVKIKKRKISFPKFGFSKSDSKVSDAEKSHPTAEGSLKEGDADVTETDVENKTKEVEADIKDSTDSPSRFRLPTIKFPKFGVSFSKTSDGQTNIQMPDASTEETTALPDIKSPEIIISVSKPELSLPEGKTEITDITIPKVDVDSEQKKEIKISSELSLSKPEVGLTDHEIDGEVITVELSKPDIKAVATDVSLPQGDFSIQEGKMEIKEPNVSFTVSEDEAEQKDLTVGSTQIKFKLPSINLPKFGGKTSKVVKDMPMIDIDAEEPDVRLPEAEISMELKDDAPLGEIKEPRVTTEGHDEGHSVDMKAEDVKPKKQEGTFKLPKIGFSKSDVPASEAVLSLPKIDASKPADSTDYEESIKETKESNAESEQDEEKLKGSPTKFKLPTIKFPKVGVSLTKTAAADHDNQIPGVTKDKPTMEIKLPEAELAGDLPSLPEMERSNIILSLSEEKPDNAHYEMKTLSTELAISKPHIKMGLVDHGSAEESAIEDSVVDTLVTEDADIPEAKDKESETKIKKHKISFPKFGFSKAETKHFDVDTSVKTERKHMPETETKDTEEAVPAPELEVQLKNKGTTGSPSKFKLPTISLPKFDISISKTEEESHGKADDVEKSERKATSQQKDLEISRDTETQDTEPSKLHFEGLPGDAEIKDKETDHQSHGSRFMTTKFEFSFPKLKRPESKKGASKMVDNVEKPEGTHDIEMESQPVDGKADVNLEYELSKPDIEAPEVNVMKEDVSMTTGEVDVKQHEPDIKTHTKTKRGSPIKFKVPSFKLPKFGSSASKVKPEVTDVTGEAHLLEAEVVLTSVDISDGKIDLTVSNQDLDFEQPTVDTGDISLPDTKSGKPEFEDEVPQESDSMGKKTKQTDFSLPKFQKPDISTPEGSVDPAETNIDIKVSQMESGQKDSIFGSPTKFKLPSISFPKFGGKSQKVAVDTKAAESEIEATNTKIDSSQLEADFEVHPSNIEIEDTKGSADVPVVDSKGLEVKKKRSGFSFPKFGFSKPELTPPELDVSVQKTDISIPESIVHVTDQTAEITLPMVGMEAEQKDLTIVGYPPKIEMPSVNLPTFEVKTSKDTVHLSSEINVPEPEIKVSAQIPTTDPAIREKEVDMFATGGKVVIPSADTDIQYISIEGKADIPVADSKDLDVKLKKPSFSLPKLGFSKPDIKEQEADVSQPRIDVSMVEGNIPVVTEISFPETGEMETIDTKTNVDIKIPSVNVDIKTRGVDIDESEIKFKLPKFGIGMQKVKESETKYKETETGPLLENEVQEPEGAIQDETIKREADNVEMESKGIKVKLPKIGFSKQELKSPEVDISLPKVDIDISMGIADSQQSADIASPEKETDLKDDAVIGSPSKFKLPTFNFPKFGIKSSKSTVKSPTVNVDAGPEVSLPEENITISSEVPTVDIKEPKVEVEDISTEINIKGKNIDKEQKEGKFKLPKFGIGLPKIKGPESKTLTDSEEKGDLSADIKEPMLSSETVEVDKEAKSTELDIEESQLKLPKLKSPEIDINIPKVEVSHTDTKKATPLNAEDLVVEEPAGLSSKEVTVKIKKPSFAFPKIGFSKSDGKAQDIQVSELTADISFPEGSVKIEDSDKDIKSPEGETEITSPQFGSPTKFKLPTIKLPKFGLSASTKVSKGEVKGEEVETQKMDPLDDKTGATDTTSVDTNIKANLDNQDGQDIKFKLPKFEISLPKVKGPEVGVATKELKTEAPEVGISESDTSAPKADTDIQQGSASIQKTEAEAELKDDKAVTGSPSKFKLPSFKMPKFGISTQKSSDVKTDVTEADEPNIKTDLNVDNKPIVYKDIHIEGEIKETTEQGQEVAVKKKDGDKGSPSKFKLPSIKMPKMNFSRTKSQDEDDTTIKASAPEIKIELKDDLQGPEKSPTFTRPAHGDGFEVEFNVPTLEEIETHKDKLSEKKDSEPETKVEESIEHKDKSKFKFKFPKLGFSHSLDESDKLDDTKVEESTKHDEAPVDQKVEDNKEQSKTKKGGWFKFSSPTKTAKVNKNETVQTPEEAEKRPINEDVEKETNKVPEEPEKSPMSEIVEENISPTLSIRSSEAFADISSALNTQSSPTKVKVKYAEPAAAVGVNDTHVQSDVVTSTARCELISMEPHQPEKVNIPFSSDMSSTSVDTLKQMSGEIHVITSNIQAIPETQQAAILTSLDAQGIHTSPLEVTLTSDSVLTVEETRVQSTKHTLVEKHVVKETSSDDKATIIVTRTTDVFEGDSAEPISDETASSIRRLRDTVHIEKMRFFDSVATTEEVQVTSSEISLRHMDSSTEENGEK
nr:neuroblast differentiation-associated protein AHNAK-like [Misgurnus anguillicaudatus]